MHGNIFYHTIYWLLICHVSYLWTGPASCNASLTLADCGLMHTIKVSPVRYKQQVLYCGTYLNSSSSNRSMVQEEAMRTPCLLITAARSMPRSSSLSIVSRFPTVCEMGFKANWHSSLRLGRRTVKWGMPLIYSRLTSSMGQESRTKWGATLKGFLNSLIHFFLVFFKLRKRF